MSLLTDLEANLVELNKYFGGIKYYFVIANDSYAISLALPKFHVINFDTIKSIINKGMIDSGFKPLTYHITFKDRTNESKKYSAIIRLNKNAIDLHYKNTKPSLPVNPKFFDKAKPLALDLKHTISSKLKFSSYHSNKNTGLIEIYDVSNKDVDTLKTIVKAFYDNFGLTPKVRVNARTTETSNIRIIRELK